MKKCLVLFAFLLNVQSNNLFAQEFYEILGTSHYARTIRLGNAYTGVAEGTEAIYYNIAGLADLTGYSALYSNGHGFAFFIEDTRLNDYAIAFPLPNEIGSIGISLQTFTAPNLSSDFGLDLYSLGYARKIINNLSAGLTINYYHLSANSTSASDPDMLNKITGSSFDINLGILYELPLQIKLTENDKFKIGLQLKNILNSQLQFNEDVEGNYLFQDLRIGLSYSYQPNFDKVYDLDPLKILFSFDAVFQGSKYDYTEWQPNYGIEATILEILQLSYGRENENQIKETYSYSPQHPVNRYGFGLNIPIDYLLNLNYKAILSINYSISDWQKIKEDNPEFNPFGIKSIDKNAISVGLTFTP
jgi:hypothetical protein